MGKSWLKNFCDTINLITGSSAGKLNFEMANLPIPKYRVKADSESLQQDNDAGAISRIKKGDTQARKVLRQEGKNMKRTLIDQAVVDAGANNENPEEEVK